MIVDLGLCWVPCLQKLHLLGQANNVNVSTVSPTQEDFRMYMCSTSGCKEFPGSSRCSVKIPGFRALGLVLEEGTDLLGNARLMCCGGSRDNWPHACKIRALEHRKLQQTWTIGIDRASVHVCFEQVSALCLNLLVSDV